MKKMKLLFPSTLCVLFLMGNALFAQDTEKLSSSLQKEIITELSRLIKNEYILEDIGLKMSSQLEAVNNDNFIKEGSGSEEFISKLNKELQSVYVDKHLGVLNKSKFAELRQMFGLDDDDNHQKKPESHNRQRENHGKQEANNHHKNPESHSEATSHPMSELAGSRVINRDGKPNIGLLKIDRFDGSEKGLSNMKKLFTSFAGVKAIIIDLRTCRGGDADMVKALSGYFFDQPRYLVSTIGRKDENGERKTRERWSTVNSLSSNFSNTPLYIMTSSKTFSAAESFAFGLQLNDRVTIVGEKTGGGGHMNTFFALPGGYGVSISVGRTFDGKTGKGFQSTGVLPDIQVETNHAFAKTVQLIREER